MNIYDFLIYNTMYCVILLELLVFIAAIFFVISLVTLCKTRKRIWLAAVILSLFVAYQGVPYYYEVKAAMAKDNKSVIQNYEKAINTAVFPMQKGMLYAKLGDFYQLTNLPAAIECYEKAYKYIKNYKSGMVWTLANLGYYMAGDFDKVIDISNGTGIFFLASYAYVMKNDFNSALVCVNKELERKPDAWNLFGLRANIYRNLGKEVEAKADYQKALSLCKYEKSVQVVKEQFNNKNFVRDDWNKKRANAKNNGVIF